MYINVRAKLSQLVKHILLNWVKFVGPITYLMREFIDEEISYTLAQSLVKLQSELSLPIPRNFVESDHGCTERIYFDDAGDNVTLALYNVTLTSQKQCKHNKCDCSKTNGSNDM